MLLTLALCACDPSTQPAESESVAKAEFGVFFGGQVQQREEIPFELDAARQQQGFRVVFQRPLEHARSLTWEISRPGRRKPGATYSHPDGRVTELGSSTLQAGRERVEQPLVFKPGDPLGLWNIRVVLDDQVLIDRPFTVYDAGRRKAAIKAARLPDAGK
jgi:hypothetical protein